MNLKPSDVAGRVLEDDFWRSKRDPDREVQITAVDPGRVTVLYSPSERRGSLAITTLLRDYELRERNFGLVQVGGHLVNVDALRDNTPEVLEQLLPGLTADHLYAWAENEGLPYGLPWKRPTKRAKRTTHKKES